MGLQRAIGTVTVLAGAFGAGLSCMPLAAQAAEIDEMIAPGSVISVQLAGDGKVLTADEAEMMLESEGFAVIEKERTLLGRIRIVAEGPQGQREIVLHAGDGRVMRDMFIESERPAAVIRQAEPIVPVELSKPAVPVSVTPPVPDEMATAEPEAAVKAEAEAAPPADAQDVTGAAP